MTRIAKKKREMSLGADVNTQSFWGKRVKFWNAYDCICMGFGPSIYMCSVSLLYDFESAKNPEDEIWINVMIIKMGAPWERSNKQQICIWHSSLFLRLFQNSQWLLRGFLVVAVLYWIRFHSGHPRKRDNNRIRNYGFRCTLL